MRRLLLICSLCLPLQITPPASSDPKSPTPTPMATPTPAPPSFLLVEGQLFNHIGAGVEKAQVTLVLKETGATIAKTETNELGDFKISAAKAYAGPATLRFTKQHHQPATVEVTLGEEDGPPFVDYEMRGALSLTGTITDARTQDPIANAHVLLEAGYKEWTAESATDGSFTIKKLFPGPGVLTVDKEKYARLKTGLEKIENAPLQALLLKPERIAHLRIIDPEGKPQPGVNIECREETTGDYRHLLSDTNGVATVRGLPHDAPALKIRLTHPGYVSSTEFDRTIELPEANVESSHVLVMQPAGAIAGTVRDAQDDPLLGARLTAGSVSDDRLPRAWSEFDGTYRVESVPPGEVVLTVHLGGYAPELARLTVRAGETTTCEFKLLASRWVRGTVRDPDGKALTGVYVTATRWRGEATLGLRAMTDAAGAFEILDAPLDEFQIALYATGYNPLLDQTVSPDRNDLAFALEVSESPPQGKRLATGEPAPAFKVTTLDGKSVTLDPLKGKVILLDFWATWCGPCLMEIPHLREVHDRFAKRPDFVMVSLSLDEDPAALRRFVEAKKMNWRHAGGPKSGAREAADAYHVSGIPALFVIDREGKIAATDLRGNRMVKVVAEVIGRQE